MLSVSPLQLPDVAKTVAVSSSWFERLDDPAVPPSGSLGDTVGGEWIVQLNSRTAATIGSVAEAATLFESYGVSVLAGLGTVGSLQIRVDAESAERQEKILAGLPFLASWQPNYLVVPSGIADIVNDPLVGEQWGLDQINVGTAWTSSTGTGVVVAILDSGTTLTHPDLKNNLWVNTAEIVGNGTDDDGNGFVDDVYGWNFVANNNDPTDTDGHGTHVSGIIGAVGDNNLGVVGVAPGVTLLPIKVISGSTGSTASIVSGINYAITLKTAFGVNLRVINASLGYYGSDDAVGAAIAAAGNAGIVFVASAGNDASNNDSRVHYPSGYNSLPNVISVASTDQYDSLNSTSNYGSTTVDLAAPGTRIYSTTRNGSYGYMTGTSMAAPMVSGAVAILAALHSDWTPAQFKAEILAAVDPLPNLAGKVASGGRLNIGGVFTPSDDTIPTTPSRLSIVAVSGNSATLQWIDHSKNEESFEIQQSIDGGTSWITVGGIIAANKTTTTVPLVSGAEHLFRVRAHNAVGDSEWSNVARLPIDVPTKPTTPTGVKAKVVDAATIEVSWKIVAKATAYRVERSLAGTSGWSEVYLGSGTTFRDGDLNSGTKYYYRVCAVNVFVSSNPGTVVSGKTPALPPETPTGLTATATGSSNIKLHWTAAKHATYYRIERYNPTTDRWTSIATTTATTYSNVGLKPTTNYRYRIIAVSSAGESSVSSEANATTSIAVPAAPTKLKTVAKGTSTVQLSWNSSPAATGYRIEYSLTGKKGDWQTIILSESTTTGGLAINLAAGMKHYFRVCASNSTGDSKFSNTVSALTTAIRPESVPTLDVVAESDSVVRLQWSAVPNATSYFVERSSDGSKWTRIATVSAVKTEHVVKSLQPTTTYYFRVSASSAAGTTEPGDAVAVSTRLSTPGAPTLRTLGGESVSVSWKAVKGASGYLVQRSLTGSIVWGDVYRTPDNSTTFSFTDDELEPNTEYFYRVVALGKDSTTNSAPSASKSIKTAPERPSELEVLEEGYNQLVLAWEEVDGATKYKIERFANGRWRSVGSTTLNEYTAKALKASTEYTFRVIALSKAGSSTPSKELVVETLIAPPSAPKKVKILSQNYDSLLITWQPVAGAETYLIERYDSDTRTWDEIDEIEETAYLDEGLWEANTNYSYRISGVNSSGIGKASTKVSARTLKDSTEYDAPSDLTLVSTTTKAATISLTPLQTGNFSYRVQWGTEEDFWTSQKIQASSKGLLTLTGLVSGTQYYTRVRVENGGFVSEWSDVLSFQFH